MGMQSSKNSKVFNESDKVISCELPVPNEILILILSYVDDHTLIYSIPLVCKHWNTISKDFQLWKNRLEYRKIKISPKRLKRIRENWNGQNVQKTVKLLCLNNSFGQFNCNLIRNSCGEDNFEHWVIRHGGSGMVIEDQPKGTPAIPSEVGQSAVKRCFVGSFRKCSRIQGINLPKLNIHSHMLSVLTPSIRISEWVAARWDCHSSCHIYVTLIGDDVKGVNISWNSEESSQNLWFKLEQVVLATDIPKNLYRIEFLSHGRDSAYWAGNYGPKNTGSSVILDIETDIV